MPRGRRRTPPPDVLTLEQELEQLRRRQMEVRQQIRRMRNSHGEVAKLQDKLQKQLAGAKWTVGLIRQVQPDWDEWGFYQSIQARPPTPRGRRRRATEDGGEQG